MHSDDRPIGKTQSFIFYSCSTRDSETDSNGPPIKNNYPLVEIV